MVRRNKEAAEKAAAEKEAAVTPDLDVVIPAKKVSIVRFFCVCIYLFIYLFI